MILRGSSCLAFSLLFSCSQLSEIQDVKPQKAIAKSKGSNDGGVTTDCAPTQGSFTSYVASSYAIGDYVSLSWFGGLNPCTVLMRNANFPYVYQNTVASGVSNDGGGRFSTGFNIPSAPTNANYQFYAFASGNCTDGTNVTSGSFSVSAPTNIVTYPNGGEVFTSNGSGQGLVISVNWNPSVFGGSNVNITIPNDSYSPLFVTGGNNVPNTGSAQLYVPSGSILPYSLPWVTQYRVRVASVSNSQVSDESDGTFRVSLAY